MAAFWHLLIPVSFNITLDKIDFEDYKKDHSFLPKKLADDFSQVSCREWTSESHFVGTKQKITLVYHTTEENLSQIKPCLMDAWKLIQQESSHSMTTGLEDFIQAHFKSLEITRHSLEHIDETLDEISDNYYLSYYAIPNNVVYHGWPQALQVKNSHISMDGFIFLHSHEKMNVIPEETILFNHLSEEIKSQLAERYVLAKHIYTLGF